MATPVVSTEGRRPEWRDLLSSTSRLLSREGLSAPRFALRSRRRNSLLAIARPPAESLGVSHRVPACRLVGSVEGGQSHPANRDGRAHMTLKIERFQPEGMNVRISNGQPSYSHVVTVSGAGKIVYTAGQLARDIDGNCVGKGDMRAQLEQTFQNLDRCLKAAGATWADVVKTNTFVTDFDEFQKCADVRMRYIGVATPTSTTVGVTRLAGPDFMVEIEAVAVVNS